jgi:hypothetical protein
MSFTLYPFSVAHSQTFSVLGVREISVEQNHEKERSADTASRIKWSWQLPMSVRKAFAKSKYRQWYIESMYRIENAEKQVVFRFVVNNGNLLDAEHHDSFLERHYLDVVDGSGLPKGNRSN